MTTSPCYLDVETSGSRCLIFRTGELPIPAGRRFSPSYQGCEVTALERILTQEYDFYLYFHLELPQFSFYPVPALTIFAIDNHGGSFVSPCADVSMDETDAPIYYLDRAKTLHYLAPNLRTLLSLMVFCPDFKARLGLAIPVPTPSDLGRNYLCSQFALQETALPRQDKPLDVRFFASQAAAQEVLCFVDTAAYQP